MMSWSAVFSCKYCKGGLWFFAFKHLWDVVECDMVYHIRCTSSH